MRRSNPTPKLVSHAECMQILRWLEETGSDVDRWQPYLHLFRAFCSRGSFDPGCELSYEKYLEYCRQNSLDKLAKWKVGHIAKQCSYLSTRLLLPACYRLGLEQYAYISFSRETSESFPAQVQFENREARVRLIADANLDNLEDRQWLLEVVNVIDASRTSKTPPKASPSRSGLRRTKASIGAQAGDPRTAEDYYPRKKLSPRHGGYEIVGQSINKQKWFITRLDCLLIAPKRANKDTAVQLFEPYEDVFRRIIERCGGKCHSIMDGRLISCFGLEPGFDTHAGAAIQAAILLRHRFQRINRKNDEYSVQPEFRILIHTSEAMVAKTREPPAIYSPSSKPTFDTLESCSLANTILVSPATHEATKDFFEFLPVPHPQLRCVPKVTPHAYIVLRKKDDIQTRFAPSLAHKTPLIGRDNEMKVLIDGWAKVSNGHCQLISVHGIIGIGKSRLIYEFVMKLRALPTPPLILTCQSWPNNRYAPFYPIASMLMHHLQLKIDDTPTQRQQKLASFLQQLDLNATELMPILESLLQHSWDRLPGEDTAATPPSYNNAYCYVGMNTLRERVGPAIRQVLVALARLTPVILLLKDVQWADSATRQIWDDVLGEIADQESTRILIVVSYRGLHPPMQCLNSNEKIKDLPLKPLDDEETKALAYEVAKATGFVMADTYSNFVIQKSAGIPHTIWELAGGEQEQISSFNIVLSESEPSPGEKLPIPGKHIAQIASMLGRKVDHATLRSAVFNSMELKETEPHIGSFEKGLDNLLSTELMVRTPFADETTFCFVSSRILDRFYESISPIDKAKLHSRFAEMFAVSNKEIARKSPETIARHFLFASRFTEPKQDKIKILKKAIHWWRRTAETALRGLALPEAIKSLRRCLRLVHKLEETEENLKTELEVQLDLAMACGLQWGIASLEVQRIYEKAKLLAERTSETSLVFRTQWTFWFYSYLRGDLDQAITLANELVRTKTYQEITECQLEAQHAMWDTLFHLGHFRTASLFHLQGLNLFRKMSKSERIRGYAGHAASTCCLSRSALILWLMGLVEQSMKMSEDAIEEAIGLEHANSQAQAYCHAALLCALRKDGKKTCVFAAQALEYAQDNAVEPRRIQSNMLFNIGQLLTDPKQDTITNLEETIELWRSIGFRLFETFWFSSVAEAYHAIGNPTSGLTFLEKAYQAAQETKDMFYLPEIHRWHGELLLLQSAKNINEVKEEFYSAIQCAQESVARTFELRAWISLNQLLNLHGTKKQEKNQARDSLQRCYDGFYEGFETVDLLRAKKLIIGES